MRANLMQHLHDCGAVLSDLSRRQAGWDIELTRNIIRRRKWAVIAAAAPVMAVLLLQAAYAADLVPAKIPVLGGSKAYMPLFINPKMFAGSIFVGVIAGLITGVIGAGGGYVLTPALMSFGIRGIMSVGTDQFHLFAKAIMGSGIHRKLGNVNAGLAVWFIVGSIPGANIGARLSRAVFQHSPAMSDALISAVYVIVLGTLGFYSVIDWVRLRKSKAGERSPDETTTALARRIQSVKVWPIIRYDHDIVEGGRCISAYPIIFCGLIVGFVAAIMGVGGGFLTFPMFVYGLGVSTFTTVGTSILQVAATLCYSSIFEYAIHGFVFYSVAVGTLLGSLIGVQVGAMVTKMVKGSLIRMFYALTILAGFANRLCALPRKLADLGYLSVSRSTTTSIETFGTWLFFAIVGVFAMWILVVFLKNVRAVRASEDKSGTSEDEGAEPHPVAQKRLGLIRNPGKFRMGVAGLAVFAALFAISVRPIVHDQSVLAWADGLFNSLAKDSVNYMEDGVRQAKRFEGTDIDLSIKARDLWDPAKVKGVIEHGGGQASVLKDGRVRIQGDLGKLGMAAVADAGLAFANKDKEMCDRHGATSCRVLYYWWTVFDGLTRRYIQNGDAKQAEFTKYMMTKVLEPAYNFRGLRARDIGQNALPATVLLVAYVVFTLWYGVSILYIFEGLGITVSASKEKRET